MSASSLLQSLQNKILVADGDMGTQLMAAGLPSGQCGELWNLAHPDRVLAIHRAYLDAGADCILTNTFGANGRTLARHKASDHLAALNRAAVDIARQALSDRPGFIIGDVGPVGEVMEPYGDLSAEDVRLALEPQIRSLVESGVDAILLETQTALEETAIGIEAARAAGAPCIIASMAYDQSADGQSLRTMMGTSPEEAARRLAELGVEIIALNCGTGVDMAVAARIVQIYREAAPSCFTMAQPNAGKPVLENFRTVYKQTPEEMAEAVDAVLRAGVHILGACCGSTPDHIRAIRAKVDTPNR